MKQTTQFYFILNGQNEYIYSKKVLNWSEYTH